MATEDIILPRERVEPDPEASNLTSATQFAHTAYNLLDHEALEAIEIVRKYSRKWIEGAPNHAESWEQMVDFLERLGVDLKEEFMDRLQLLVTWDPTPLLEGKEPVLTIMDKLPSEDIHKYGFDHEFKAFEVNRAVSRGEDYLGQRERPDSTPARKRARDK